MSNPWFKFYPQDWMGDEKLVTCSLASQGLWAKMLCIMHKANPRGHLLINGNPVTDAQLAALTGVDVSTVLQLRQELETNGVYSKNHKGAIYSRRMTRDERSSKEGTKHANRRWAQATDSPALFVPPSGLPSGIPTTQILDTRKEGEKEKTIKKEKPKADFEDFWNLFPRKVGKGAAEQAYWKARDQASKDQIHGSVEAQRGEMAKREKQYVPHPATWLNQKRYLDETGPVVQTTEGWPAWKFPLAAAIGEQAVHSWFVGATFSDGRLTVPMAFKAARIREQYLNDVRRILGDIEIACA